MSYRDFLFSANKDTESTAWAWGLNNDGQLGSYVFLGTTSPAKVLGDFVDWVQISAGSNFSVGLRQDGTIWSWGRNDFGQLGDGTTTYRSSPVSVAGGLSDWVYVASGSFHSVAIKKDGTVWTWGRNDQGQLGTNNTTNRSSPVSVVGGFTDWMQVTAGDDFTLGIRQNGTAWSWGSGTSGRLGSGNTTARSSPVSVVGGFTDWVHVSAGVSGSHAVGLRENGTAWAWGLGTNGRLGDGASFNRSSPVSVVGGFTDWSYVSAGGGFSVGVREDGTAWSWGINIYGQLGTNNTTNRSSPVSVVGGFNNWSKIVGGPTSTFGIRRDGTAWSWGLNNNGQLGDGTATNRSSPAPVVGGFNKWTQIFPSNTHTVALKGKPLLPP